MRAPILNSFVFACVRQILAAAFGGGSGLLPTQSGFHLEAFTLGTAQTGELKQKFGGVGIAATGKLWARGLAWRGGPGGLLRQNFPGLPPGERAEAAGS